MKTARVVLVDCAEAPGRGLAYGAADTCHLLNVPAEGMSASPEDPQHFTNWLQRIPGQTLCAGSFVPRPIFGAYLQSLFVESGAGHVRDVVLGCKATAEGYCVELAGGGKVVADRVVLATGHHRPAPLPKVDPAVIGQGLYQHDVWYTPTGRRSDGAALRDDLPILLIGSGLTAVDMVLRLRAKGYAGRIVACSRHAIAPVTHAATPVLAHPAVSMETHATALAYFRAFRAACRDGVPWRSGIDSLRGISNHLWCRLPYLEKQRFRRHLQRRWDVARHRVAPEIAALLQAEFRSGTFEIMHGRIAGVEACDDHAQVLIAGRDAPFQAAQVLNCTGPDLKYQRVGSSLLDGLFDAGLIVSGFESAGIATDADGAVIAADGHVSERLFAVGPMRLGTLFESVAVPEIRVQARDLALHLAAY